MDVHVGERWASFQTNYRGWKVMVERTTASYIRFRLLCGPGRSRGTLHWVARDHFVTSFKRLAA